VLLETGLDGSVLPVVAVYTGTVLDDPSDAELMAALGVTTHPSTARCDLAILGSGPAGLAAAVYAASEGLQTLVLEPEITGGQAGTSSLTRNYLGCISGEELAPALDQAWLFGADFVLSQRATHLRSVGTSGWCAPPTAPTSPLGPWSLRPVSWRRLGVPALEALVGAGVFYGAGGAEAGNARAMRGRNVAVGARNSAGQATLHLARYARSVTMLILGAVLEATMSEYLVTAISGTPNILPRRRCRPLPGGSPATRGCPPDGCRSYRRGPRPGTGPMSGPRCSASVRSRASEDERASLSF